MKTLNRGPQGPAGRGASLYARTPTRTSYPDLSPQVKHIPQNPTWPEWADSVRVALGPGPEFDDFHTADGRGVGS